MTESDFEIQLKQAIGKRAIWCVVALMVSAVSVYAYDAGYSVGTDLAQHQSSPSGGGGSAKR